MIIIDFENTFEKGREAVTADPVTLINNILLHQ